MVSKDINTKKRTNSKKNILRFMTWRFDVYFPAFIVFVITLIPLFFTKLLFIADWERPKDLNGIDARVIIFWGYVFGMVLPIGLVAFRGYIIQQYEGSVDIFIVRSDICNLNGVAFCLIVMKDLELELQTLL